VRRELLESEALHQAFDRREEYCDHALESALVMAYLEVELRGRSRVARRPASTVVIGSGGPPIPRMDLAAESVTMVAGRAP